MSISLETKCARAMILDVLKMKKGESLAITADQGSNFPLLEEYLNVAHENDIVCTILKTATPPGRSKMAEVTIPVPATIAFLMEVDCWIDAGAMGLLYSDLQEHIDANNERMRYILTCAMTTEEVDKTFCSFNVEDMVELTTLLMDKLRKTKKVTMKNEFGTNVSFEMEPTYVVEAVDGNAGTPGRYTPPALVNVYPKFGSANGTIAVAENLIFIRDLTLSSQDPLLVELKDGEIVNFSGNKDGVAEIAKWRDMHVNDQNARKVAHMNIGLAPEVQELTGSGILDERLWGGANWGFGHVSPKSVPPQGQPSETHIDLITEKVSVWLDDEQVMEKGNFVEKELKTIADRIVK